MAPPTPSPMPNTRSTPATLQHQPKSTPHHSKHRLHFPGPNPKAPPGAAPSPAADHPVEVIGRIRDHPADSLKDKDKNTASSVLEIAEEGRSVRVCTDVGYRDFALDGVSVSGQEDLEAFYRRFVASRAEGVRLGAKCTIMMYGPTGSGKSHTMFGCPKQPGIVYRALRDILGHGGGSDGDGDRGTLGIGTNAPFVQVAVLEIYNEEIYDLLSGASNGGCGGPNLSLSKGSTAPKVRLEVMGKKAKNASYISGNEAAKITKEVAKVEKRRIVRSTHCNERSSRSHCMIILDVPSVGGRLMLVDMAGSENIEAAGQASLEAKMQTAKINQGNVALKRVVESIANGDSHVPFRDSKLTMLLQDSFEDDKSKILMILCASPDPKETHKTLSTFEYGAKAKCIVRVAHMPALKEKVDSEESSIILKSQIIAMNKYIYKLQTENKVKERERDEAQKKLLQKEAELVQLRTKLQLIEGKDSEVTEEEVVNLMVDQKSKTLRLELKRMEERMLQQQEELNFLRQRLEELQLEGSTTSKTSLQDKHGRICMNRQESCAGDHAVVKSMELDMGDVHNCYVVKEIREDSCLPESYQKPSLLDPCLLTNEDETDTNILRFPDRVCLRGDEEEETDTNVLRFPDRVCLSTVFEEDEEDEQDEEEEKENAEVGVDKEVVEVNHGSRVHGLTSLVDPALRGDADRADCGNDSLKRKVLLDTSATDNTRDALSARKTRIQNIFRLCGNHRELARQVKTSSPLKSVSLDENRQHSSPLALGEAFGTNLGLQTEQPQPTTNCKLLSESRAEESPVSSLLESFASFKLSDEQKSDEQELLRCVSSVLPKDSKENHNPCQADSDGFVEVHVKWEASKEFSGSLIKKLKLSKNSSLSDLRKLIEIDLEEDKKFSFLLFGDPSGTPIAKEKEVATQLHELPICNHQLNCRLACLRPVKKVVPKPDHVPFGSLENTLNSVLHF